MKGYGTKNNTNLESVEYALRCGYKLLDTEDTNNNIFFNFKNININKNKIILCSKLMGEFSYNNHHPKNVFYQCKRSLEKAKLTYWDIYYIHTTHSFGNFPILDTFNELIKLKEAKLIRKTGLSNITFEQLETFIINDKKPDYIQIEIHPYLTEDEIVKLCNKNNIKIVCHSPFGSYKLRKRIVNEPILIKLSKKYNKTVYQIILKWHVSRNIIPIPSSNNKDNIIKNLSINFNIAEEDLQLINNLNKNNRVYIKPNHFKYRFIKTDQKIPFLNLKKLSLDSKKYERNEIQQKILNDFQEKGYCVTNLEVMDKNLFNLAKKILNKINILNISDMKSQLFDRDFQLNLSDCFQEQIQIINNSKFIRNLSKILLNSKNYNISTYVSTNIIQSNLQRTKSQLFHRDLQHNCLKILIYLNEVNEYNGPFEIINGEKYNNLEWFFEKNHKKKNKIITQLVNNLGDKITSKISSKTMSNLISIWNSKYTKKLRNRLNNNKVSSMGYSIINCPKTTDKQILKHKLSIDKITGPKYTCILFHGRKIHRGGFIQKGLRHAIYIEVY